MERRGVNYEKGVRQQLDVCAIAKAVFGVNKTLLQAGRQAGRKAGEALNPKTLNPISQQGPAPDPSYVKRTSFVYVHHLDVTYLHP
jgi:hypothetical protein